MAGDLMRAVLYLAARELRHRWRGWGVLVVLVAIAGGAVLAAAAGASRTWSAYPRFLKASKASDVLVAPYVYGLGGYLDALARLPGATVVAPVVGLAAWPLGRGGRLANTMAPVDQRFGRLLEIPKVLAGRLPAPSRAGDIAVSQRAAAMMGLRVGSPLTVRAEPNGLPPGVDAAALGPARPRLLRERVVGIVVTRGSILPVTEQDKAPILIANPALFHRLGVQYAGYSGAYVKLRPGISAEVFQRQAQSLAGQFPATGGRVFVADEGAQATASVLRAEALPSGAPADIRPPGYEFVLVSFTPGPRRAANIASFQRSMTRFCQSVQQSSCVLTSQRPDSVASYASIDRIPSILAALLAIFGTAVLGQFIVVSGRRRRDFAILRALGMSRRQVSAITAWQVSTLTGLALLAGLPLGVAAGRRGWAVFAHGLGIPPVAITPVWPVLLTVPAVIVIANAVAIWPGQATARQQPAEVLRVE